MSQMLQIPLRARLVHPAQASRLFWKQHAIRYILPRPELLLDTPVTRLPKLPRRLRK